MGKIYYNLDGWVCSRYPTDIPIDENSKYIEVDEEIENKTYYVDVGYAWRVVDGKLVVEKYGEIPAYRLLSWILTMMDKVTVLEPDAIRQKLFCIATELTKKYRKE